MEMTLRAINSLILSTPVVFVGILVPPCYGILSFSPPKKKRKEKNEKKKIEKKKIEKNRKKSPPPRK